VKPTFSIVPGKFNSSPLGQIERTFCFGARQLSKVTSVIETLSNEDLDSPEDADIYETKLRDGDLVIAYVSKTQARFDRRTHLSLFRRTDCQTTSSIMRSPRFAAWCFGLACRKTRR
jgi:hypothetical protein